MSSVLRDAIVMLLAATAGVVATVVAWTAVAATVAARVEGPEQLLVSVLVGMAGPALLWFLATVLPATRHTSRLRPVVAPAAVGLGLVLAAQAAFYVPLGFFAIALGAL